MDYQARPELTERERLIVIERLVGTIHQNLFGNGQPGIIADLRERIEEVDAKLGGRIVDLEKADKERKGEVNGQRGVWTMLGTIIGLVIGLAALVLGR